MLIQFWYNTAQHGITKRCCFQFPPVPLKLYSQSLLSSLVLLSSYHVSAGGHLAFQNLISAIVINHSVCLVAAKMI